MEEINLIQSLHIVRNVLWIIIFIIFFIHVKKHDTKYKILLLYIFLITLLRIMHYLFAYTNLLQNIALHKSHEIIVTQIGFIIQNSLLSYLYYLLFTSNKKQQTIVAILSFTSIGAMVITFVVWYHNPYLFFTMITIPATFILISILGIMYYFDRFSEQQKPYIYLTKGLLLYLFISTVMLIIYTSLIITDTRNSQQYLTNMLIALLALLDIVFIAFLYKEWRNLSTLNKKQ